MPLIFAALLTIIFVLDAYFWHGAASKVVPLIDVILIAIVLGSIAIAAGVIIVKSLVKVATGLSLLIFLSQSYCGPTVTRTNAGNNALQALLMIGLLYVTYDFLLSVWNDIKGYKKSLGKEGWDWKPKTVYVLSLLFIVSFTIGIYDVVKPIILGLCVYTK